MPARMFREPGLQKIPLLLPAERYWRHQGAGANLSGIVQPSLQAIRAPGAILGESPGVEPREQPGQVRSVATFSQPSGASAQDLVAVPALVREYRPFVPGGPKVDDFRLFRLPGLCPAGPGKQGGHQLGALFKRESKIRHVQGGIGQGLLQLACIHFPERPIQGRGQPIAAAVDTVTAPAGEPFP